MSVMIAHPQPPTADNVCPHCHGLGYLAADAPCLACPGPQLVARFSTVYDGVGSKGISSATCHSPSNPAARRAPNYHGRSASLPSSRRETKVFVEGVLITPASAYSYSSSSSSSSSFSSSSSLPSCTAGSRPRWSLKLDFFRRRSFDNDSDSAITSAATITTTAAAAAACLLPSSSATAASSSALPSPRGFVQRLKGPLTGGPRRSKRWNARQEVAIAERALKELMAKAQQAATANANSEF
ncbi:hypothetical protein HDU89_004243 [Geranomyces variabilis]|nr:hypothetical protein HDU89_004243 [Geranomyces variabilis]